MVEEARCGEEGRVLCFICTEEVMAEQGEEEEDVVQGRRRSRLSLAAGPEESLLPSFQTHPYIGSDPGAPQELFLSEVAGEESTFELCAGILEISFPLKLSRRDSASSGEVIPPSDISGEPTSE